MEVATIASAAAMAFFMAKERTRQVNTGRGALTLILGLYFYQKERICLKSNQKKTVRPGKFSGPGMTRDLKLKSSFYSFFDFYIAK